MEILQKFTPEQLAELANFRNGDANIVHYLAENNQHQALAFLFDKLPRDLFTKTYISATPMHLAITHKSVECVMFFEDKKIETFVSDEERKAFYGQIVEPLPNPQILLDVRSPLISAVAAGQLASVEILLLQYSSLLESELLQANNENLDRRKNFLLDLLFLAIENKNEHIFTVLLAKIKTFFTPQELYQWLIGKTKSDLVLTGSLSPLISLFNNAKHPFDTIRFLFADDYPAIRKSLIQFTLEQNQAKYLSALLADADDNEDVIDLLFSHALSPQFYLYHLNSTLNYMQVPDVLDVVARACGNQFNTVLQQNPQYLLKYLEKLVSGNQYFILLIVLQNLTPDVRKIIFASTLTNGMTLLQLATQHKCNDTITILKDFGAEDGNVAEVKSTSPIAFLYLAANIIAKGDINEDALTKLTKATTTAMTAMHPEVQRICARPLLKILTLVKDSQHFAHVKPIYDVLIANFAHHFVMPIRQLDFYLYTQLMGFALLFEDKQAAVLMLNSLSQFGNAKGIPERFYASNNFPQITVTRLSLIFWKMFNIPLDDDKRKLQSLSLDAKSFSIENFVSFLPLTQQKEFTPEQLEDFLNHFQQLPIDDKNFSQVSLSDNFYDNYTVQQYARTYLSIVTMFQSVCHLEKFMCPEALDVKNNLHALEKIHYFAKIKEFALLGIIRATTRLDKDLRRPGFPLLANMYAELDQARMLKAYSEKSKVEKKLPEPIISNQLIWAIQHSNKALFISTLKNISDTALLTVYHDLDDTNADYFAEQLIKKGNLELFTLFYERMHPMASHHFKQRLLPLAVRYHQTDIINFLINTAGINFATPAHEAAFLNKKIDSTLKNFIHLDVLNSSPLEYAVSGGNLEQVKQWRAITPKDLVPDELLLMRCLQAKQLHLLPFLMSNIPALTFLKIIPNILSTITEEYPNPSVVLDLVIQATKESNHIAFRKKIAIEAMNKGEQGLMLHALKSLPAKERLNLTMHLMSNLPETPGTKGQPSNFTVHAKIITLLTREMVNDFRTSPQTLNNIMHMFFTTKNWRGLQELLVNLPPVLITLALNAPNNLLQLTATREHIAFFILFYAHGRNEHDNTQNKLVQKLFENFDSSLIEHITIYVKIAKHFAEFHHLLFKIIQGESLIKADLQAFFEKIDDSAESYKFLGTCLLNLINTLNWMCCFKRHIDYPSILVFSDIFISRLRTSPTNLNPDSFYSLANIAFMLGDIKRASNYLDYIDWTTSHASNPTSIQYVRPRINRLILAVLHTFEIPMTDEHKQYYLDYWYITRVRPILFDDIFSTVHADTIQLDKKKLISFVDLLRHYPPETTTRSDINHQCGSWEVKELIETHCKLFEFFQDLEERLLADIDNNIDLLYHFYAAMLHVLPIFKPNLTELPIAAITVSVPGRTLAHLNAVRTALEPFLERAQTYVNAQITSMSETKTEGQTHKAEMPTKSDKSKSKHAASKSLAASPASSERKKTRKQVFITGSPSQFSDIPQLNTSTDEKLSPRKIPVHSQPGLLKPFYSTDARVIAQTQSAPNTVSIPRKEVADSPPLQKPTFGPSAAKAPEKTPSSSGGLFKKSSDTPSLIELSRRPKVDVIEHPLKTPTPKLGTKRSKRNFDINALIDFPDLMTAETTPTTEKQPGATPDKPIAANPTIPTSRFAQVPEEICRILRHFNKRFGNSPIYAYLTGGAVRDCIEGKPAKDWDIGVISCLNIELLYSILKDELHIPPGRIQILGVGDTRHIFVDYNGHKIDFVLEQFARRDFTINSIYWHPDLAMMTGNPDAVKDPKCGQLDLRDKKLRFGTEKQNFIDNQFLFFRLIYIEKKYGYTRAKSVQAKLDEAVSLNILSGLPYKFENKQALITHHEKCKAIYKDNIEEYYDKLRQVDMYAGMAAIGLVPKEAPKLKI